MMATQQLAQINLLKVTGQIPPEIVAVLTAITVSTDNDEVRIKASVAEKDVLGAIAFAMNNLGSP
jgi:hypothetical protein